MTSIDRNGIIAVSLSQARQATEAAAIALYGPDFLQKTSTSDAWEAMGVR